MALAVTPDCVDEEICTPAQRAIWSMHPLQKDLWVSGLRHGGYPQCRHQLETEDHAFDVLGVLCDVAARHGIVERRHMYLSGHDQWLWGYGTPADFAHDRWEGYTLPPAVIRWAGLKDRLGVTELGLVAKNDCGWTFIQLADFIEETL